MALITSVFRLQVPGGGGFDAKEYTVEELMAQILR